MRKEIFIDNIAEYQYLKEDSTHSLFYNNGEQWNESTKNTLVLQIKDTGDGFIISQETSQDKKNHFDYMMALHFTILMKLIHSEENYVFEMAEKSVF